MANKAEEIRIQNGLGMTCSSDLRKFKYYTILLNMLKCYTVDDSLTEDAQDLINCLTTDEVDIIFAKFMEYCDHCYPLETVDIDSLNNCPTCT